MGVEFSLGYNKLFLMIFIKRFECFPGKYAYGKAFLFKAYPLPRTSVLLTSVAYNHIDISCFHQKVQNIIS